MPALDIPPSGLSFESVSEQSSKSTSQDIIGLTLTDDLIEEMIQCVQNGKQISLSLGPRPNISFGNTTQQLADYRDPFAHEIYQSTSDSTSNHRMTMKPAGKPCMAFIRQFNSKFTPNAAAAKKSAASTTKAVTAGVDSARENLERSMALAKAKKEENTTRFVGLQVGGKKGKVLSQGRLNDTTRSMPGSPALSGVGSPSLGPTSVPTSQSITEQAKANRKAIVHLLAVRPMTEQQLRERADDLSDSDFKQALNKVADKVSNGQEYELFKSYYKELDVWTFNYDTEEDRQKAIDNAVKQYDRLRIAPNDDEWERLKPFEQRGDGQSLSQVQSRIAQGPIPRTPKISVSNADSGRDTPGHESEAPGNKSLSKLKKDAINRASSQPTSTSVKAKRVSEKEAQSKRLLSAKPKPAAVPVLKKETVTKSNAPKALSSQFVTESDDEEVTRPAAPPPKAVSKKPNPAPKRAREEESTSDSSQPLSKKIRASNGKPAEPVRENNNKNFSQSSSSTNRTTKGTSPQKSSPLASSPPTNASDFASSGGSCAASDSSTPRHHSNFSSKGIRSPVHKRNASTSSLSTTSSASSTASYNKVDAATLQIASNFRVFYPKYAALHKELSKLREEDRDQKRVDHLIDMHDRLVEMKTKIKQAALRMAN